MIVPMNDPGFVILSIVVHVSLVERFLAWLRDCLHVVCAHAAALFVRVSALRSWKVLLGEIEETRPIWSYSVAAMVLAEGQIPADKCRVNGRHGSPGQGDLAEQRVHRTRRLYSLELPGIVDPSSFNGG